MRKRLGVLLVFSGASLVGIFCLVRLARALPRTYTADMLGAPESGGMGDFAVVFLVAVVLLALVGAFLGPTIKRYGHRLLAPGADEALAADPRPRILFLRSFGDDEAFPLGQWGRSNFDPLPLEEAIAGVLGRFGPVYAIGRPKEFAPPLGAARKYVAEDWQGEVLRGIGESRHVVVVLGRSEGLVWELNQIVRLGALGKTIFVLPPVKRPGLQKRWLALAGAVAAAPGAVPVPESVPADAVFATFGPSGECVVHEARGVRTAWFFRRMDYHYTKALAAILGGPGPGKPRSLARGLVMWVGSIAFVAVAAAVFIGIHIREAERSPSRIQPIDVDGLRKSMDGLKEMEQMFDGLKKKK